MRSKNLLPLICIVLINIIQNLSAQVPAWAWAHKGETGAVYGLAKDNLGNTVAVGNFSADTIKFNTTILVNSAAGNDDIFVTKFDGNGNVIWAKGAKDNAGDYAYGVSVDASGNNFVCGSFSGDTLSFGAFIVKNTTPGTGTRDAYIAKLDASGNPLWVKGGGGSGTDEAYSIVADASGNSYVTGYFSSTTMVLGSYTLTQTGMKDIFLAKYDSNGNILWAKNASGNDQDYSRSITLDPTGNVWITGYFQSTNLAIGTTTLINGGGGFSDIFVLKFDINGNTLLGKRFGVGSHEQGYSISADPSGNIFVGGWFLTPSFSIGTTTLTNNTPGKADWFLAKLDQNANPLWAKSAGGSLDDVINSISADASGNVYTTGAFRNTVAFTTSTLTSLGFQDVFVAKYNSAGVEQFVMRAGASYFDGGTAILADNINGCVVAGSFQDSVKFGSQPTLIGNGMFIAKSGSITGIKGFDKYDGLHMYPNPSSGKLFIQSDHASINFEVLNSLGEKVLSGRSATEIDLSGFSAGIYFVKLFNGTESRVEKIIME
jgi:hypothetical protein